MKSVTASQLPAPSGARETVIKVPITATKSGHNATVILENVRLCFPRLWVPSKPKTAPENAPLKYSAAFLWEKDSQTDRLITKLVHDLAVHQWTTVPFKLGSAVHPGEEKAEEFAEYTGMNFLSANDKHRPHVLNAEGVAVLADDPGAPYPGCYVRARVEFYTLDLPQKAIWASLLAVQVTGPGERLSGRKEIAAEDCF